MSCRAGKHKAISIDHSSRAPCDGGAAAFVGTRRSESKLERENGRLREQLKFQVYVDRPAVRTCLWVGAEDIITVHPSAFKFESM